LLVAFLANHDDRLPVAGCRLPVAGCRLPVAGCRLPVAGCEHEAAEGYREAAGAPITVFFCLPETWVERRAF